jgi:3-oxoadipate enol-lactonase
MPFAELPGVRLYYETAGSGPRLLVVNGTGSDLRQQPNPLAWPLARRFELLTYDHRGLGQSVPSDVDAQPTVDEMAGDAVALLDHVGWDRCAVLGVSFGGMVAQEIALAAPGRVTRLVLSCTSSGGAGGASYPLHEVYALPAGERAARHVDLIDTRCADEPGRRKLLLDFFASRAGGDPSPGLVRQLEARRLHDTWDRLPTLDVPTLVAAGRYDGIAPLANAEALAGRIPDARLDVFEGGHAFFLDDRRAWPAIMDFLAAGEGGGETR